MAKIVYVLYALRKLGEKVIKKNGDQPLKILNTQYLG